MGDVIMVDRDGLDILNVKMMPFGSSIARQCRIIGVRAVGQLAIVRLACTLAVETVCVCLCLYISMLQQIKDGVDEKKLHEKKGATVVCIFLVSVLVNHRHHDHLFAQSHQLQSNSLRRQ